MVIAENVYTPHGVSKRKLNGGTCSGTNMNNYILGSVFNDNDSLFVEVK